MCSIIAANTLNSPVESSKSHINDMIINLSSLHYPITENDRRSFQNPKTGKTVTEFQFKVYDLCSQVTFDSFRFCLRCNYFFMFIIQYLTRTYIILDP